MRKETREEYANRRAGVKLKREVRAFRMTELRKSGEKGRLPSDRKVQHSIEMLSGEGQYRTAAVFAELLALRKLARRYGLLRAELRGIIRGNRWKAHVARVAPRPKREEVIAERVRRKAARSRAKIAAAVKG
jgi:hypothetical protein